LRFNLLEKEGGAMANRTGRVLGWVAAGWAVVFFIGASFRVLADCASFGLPFTDLGAEGPGFCAIVAEAYFSGLTNGTSGTAYSPGANVTRLQMAAFVTRTLDASLSRGSRRAALNQWWNSTPHFDQSLGLTTVDSHPQLMASDGADIWVANLSGNTVSRVRGSDGSVLGTWTGATNAAGVLIAMGRVFVTGETTPGKLYMIDPTAAPGAVTTVTSSLGDLPLGIAFDGNNIWTANIGGVSIVTPGTWAVNTVTAGFSEPIGALFDGTNVWVTDPGDGTLKKLNSDGSIAQSLGVGSNPSSPVFDGHNIWVPNLSGNSLTVVRASDGLVLKTFSAGNGDQNGMNQPTTAAFDGQRILVTNQAGGLSLFQATTLSPIGFFATTGMANPYGACSDGASFWVSFYGSGKIGRF
jgi:DNA-binding beta-propeller fold protein YncE